HAVVTIERLARLEIHPDGVIVVHGYDPASEQYVEETRVSVGPDEVQWDVTDGDALLARRGEGGFFIAYRTPRAASEAARRTLALDASYDSIVPGSWVIVERAGETDAPAYRVVEVASVSIAA